MKQYVYSLKSVIYNLNRRWGAIFIVFGYFFIPDQVLAIVEDQYRLTTIELRVDLTYNNERTQNMPSDTTSSSERFEQRYSLDAKGLVVSPDLMTYKAGIEFMDTDASGSSGDFKSTLLNYVFGSTILRKSRIPLTLEASRNISGTTYGGETLKDKYGVDWYLKFRTLPWTRLTFDKTQTRADGVHEDIDVTKIELSKSIGPSSNKLYYSLTDSADPLRSYDAHSRFLGFINDTNLPLQTDLYVKMQRSDSYDASSDSNTTTGSVGLKSEPVSGFRQKFSYTLTDGASGGGGNDTGTVMEAFKGRLEYDAIENMYTAMDYQKSQNDNSQSYADLSGYSSSSASDRFAGIMNYRPTKNVYMFAGASSSSAETSSSESSDVKSSSADYSAGASHSHAITRNLSAQESANYSKSEASNGDAITGLTSRSITDANAALNYTRSLSWSNLGTGASVGVHHETVEPGGEGTGVFYGYNAGLSEIKRRHFTLGTRYNYSGVYSTVGNIDSKDQTFSMNAVGNHGERLPMNISYDYHILDSYVWGEDVAEQTLSASTGIYYIQKLPITIGYSYFTLLRTDDIPPELQYIYTKEKVDYTFDATVGINHIKWLPISTFYQHHLLLQPYEIPSAELSADQQYYHTEEQKEEKIGLSSNLTYFRTISVSGSMSYSFLNEVKYVTSTGLTEENGYRKKNMSLNGSHNRTFLRGRLGLSTGYNVTITDNITQDIRDYYSILNFNGTYDKRMSRNMMLKLVAGQSFTDSNGVLDSQLTGQVNVFYKLRAWLFSAEYQHAVKNRDSTEDSTVIEDRFMLKASRSFIRVI